MCLLGKLHGTQLGVTRCGAQVSRQQEAVTEMGRQGIATDARQPLFVHP